MGISTLCFVEDVFSFVTAVFLGMIGPWAHQARSPGPSPLALLSSFFSTLQHHTEAQVAELFNRPSELDLDTTLTDHFAIKMSDPGNFDFNNTVDYINMADSSNTVDYINMFGDKNMVMPEPDFTGESLAPFDFNLHHGLPANGHDFSLTGPLYHPLFNDSAFLGPAFSFPELPQSRQSW